MDNYEKAQDVLANKVAPELADPTMPILDNLINLRSKTLLTKVKQGRKTFTNASTELKKFRKDLITQTDEETFKQLNH